MTEERPYNKFIRHPSNSNVLINTSLVISFIILVICQFFLFRVMSQQRLQSMNVVRDGTGNSNSTDAVFASSAMLLTSCSDEDLSDAVARVKPSIVNIDVASFDVGASSQRRGAGTTYDMPPQQALKSNNETLGSGIIVDSRGYILTCYHLIKESPAVYVTVFSAEKRTYKADVVVVDEEHDLAALRIYADATLPAAKLGNSDMVKTTDTVLTIGSPFGFEHTVTEGIISDDKRALIIDERLYKDLFQIDASINRGSAGGALINSEGEVIGINTAIVSASEHFAGIGFAIPINQARQVIFQASIQE